MRLGTRPHQIRKVLEAQRPSQLLYCLLGHSGNSSAPRRGAGKGPCELDQVLPCTCCKKCNELQAKDTSGSLELNRSGELSNLAAAAASHSAQGASAATNAQLKLQSSCWASGNRFYHGCLLRFVAMPGSFRFRDLRKPEVPLLLGLALLCLCDTQTHRSEHHIVQLRVKLLRSR